MKILEERVKKIRNEMEKGRGGELLYPSPIELEPPFSPFVHERGKPSSKAVPSPEPKKVGPAELSFLRIRPSEDDKFSAELSEQLLLSLSSEKPLAFEIANVNGRAIAQIAAAHEDIDAVNNQISSHYPEAEVFPDEDLLRREGFKLHTSRSYRLRDSHLFPIRTGHRTEPYNALLSLLAGLGEGEAALFQVLFMPVRNNWKTNILNVSQDPWDPAKSPFIDLPDLPKKAQEKVKKPIFAAALRLAATTEKLLARIEGAFLSQFEGEENGFILQASEYPVESILQRTTYTPGMLLNAAELASLVHLPNPEDVPDAMEEASHTSAPPPLATKDILVPLGVNIHRGRETAVGISGEYLTRHAAIFGGSGFGKTNLMKYAFGPLLETSGMALLDPKGDAAYGFLNLIPEHRINDVLYFDPADRFHPPALNVLASSSSLENEKLTAELMVGLKRLFTGSKEFGSRTEWILRQTIRTLLDSEGEKTLRDIPRFLEETNFRAEVLETVSDRELQSFWDKRDLKPSVVDPILNRLSSFLDRPTIRDIVGQHNRIDFHQIIRDKKIFIANLEKGELKDAAFVLGSFILSRLQMAALARPMKGRDIYPVLVDEFHNFAGHGMDTESIETFLSEARSFRVPLVVATQFPNQLAQSVIKAIFGNVGTLISMRCGMIDAKLLEQELTNFDAEDIQSQARGEGIVRMQGGYDFNLKVPRAKEEEVPYLDTIIARSRKKLCPPREEQETQNYQSKAKQESEPPSLEPDEASFLHRIASYPEETVTTACQALGLSGSRSLSLRRKLVSSGLMVEIDTRLGGKGRPAKYATPTLKGYHALGEKPPRGRGGPIHKHFTYLISQWAAEKGYQVETEHQLEDGWVDLHLERDGEATALEVSISSTAEREIENLRKCLKAGYPRVVVLFLDETVLQDFQKQVSKQLSQGEGEINSGSLNDFYHIL